MPEIPVENVEGECCPDCWSDKCPCHNLEEKSAYQNSMKKLDESCGTSAAVGA